MRAMSDIDLDAIIEAGKRATPRPWRSMKVFDRPDRAFLAAPLVPIFLNGGVLALGSHAKVADADYIELAANHADTLASRLKAQDAVLARVKAILNARGEWLYAAGDCRKIVLDGVLARELAKLLERGNRSDSISGTESER